MCLLAVFSARLHAGTNAVADESNLEARWQDVRGGVVLFHSYRCQYCQKELAFLESIRSRYPEIGFSFFEIGRPENAENLELFSYVMGQLGSNEQGVPRTVIDGKVFIGFLEGDCALSYNEVYQAYNGCQSLLLAEFDGLDRQAGREIRPALPALKRKFVVYNNLTLFLLVPMFALSRYVFKDRLTTPQARRYWWAGLFALLLACIILFLVLTPQSQILKASESMPFPAFVFFIAIVDGFNPCSFSILIIFLSLLTYTRARKDMIIVGSAFIVTSAVVYGILILSMMALTAVFFARYEDTIGKVLGAIILVLGIVNVKDLVIPGKGPSLVVPAARKAAIVRRFTRILRGQIPCDDEDRAGLADRASHVAPQEWQEVDGLPLAEQSERRGAGERVGGPARESADSPRERQRTGNRGDRLRPPGVHGNGEAHVDEYPSHQRRVEHVAAEPAEDHLAEEHAEHRADHGDPDRDGRRQRDAEQGSRDEHRGGRLGLREPGEDVLREERREVDRHHHHERPPPEEPHRGRDDGGERVQHPTHRGLPRDEGFHTRRS